ncbi:conjugal transfer protein TraM [Variovorax sp. RHLX14]|uniref:conjugal transfer protein TraM n=1 Tax=Variovorax sp. RHLX14 TaxID=1259731 RepID=UPI003F46839F
MADDSIDHLIREIAAKHGVAVGRDDPILILQTLNARLLEQGAEAQRAMLQTHKEELELIAQRWGEEAKSKAERILNAGLVASKDAMARAMQEGALVATASLRKEMESAASGITHGLTQVRRLAHVNLIAAALTVIAAAITLFATVSW